MKKICLIITGGIAAVKIYDLVRALIKKEYCVTCVLTSSAKKFVTEIALTALTGQKTYHDLWDDDQKDYMDHIHLSRAHDMVVIAPATADFIARIAHGFSSDLASALVVASDKPVMIAPAMNPHMWAYPAVQNNISLLSSFENMHIITPETGLMACGETGLGRMAEPDTIIEYIISLDQKKVDLSGKKILITSGATIEKIDPVRFLSNFSSGKQGTALAKTALSCGAEVFFVTGKTQVPLPVGAHITHITSADDLYQTCNSLINAHHFDFVLCAAAVSDWTCPPSDTKNKKQSKDKNCTLTFHQTQDVLHMMSTHKNRPDCVIGFAAETDHLHQYAREKLQKKQCDYILMNDVSGNVFGSDHNHLWLFSKDTEIDLGHGTKADLAHIIFKKLITDNKQ